MQRDAAEIYPVDKFRKLYKLTYWKYAYTGEKKKERAVIKQ